jgi:hypothetical protein
VKYTHLAQNFGSFSLEKLSYRIWQNTLWASSWAIFSQQHLVTLAKTKERDEG